MRILTINQDWFAREWREAGHEVMTCGPTNEYNFLLQPSIVHIDSLIDMLPGGFKPDAIVHFDNSFPVLVAGLDETDIPSVFYSVDAHHHFAEHRYAALMFDEVLVAQKDYLHEFESAGSDPKWMPLWATRYMELSTDKKYKAVFVGNLNAKLNPERVKFFNELGSRIELECKMGCYWEIFPFSEIVINQTVKGDLNFRVFEGMMSGALLLTERSGNGLSDLFNDGEHLVTYEKNNVDQAVDIINQYLGDLKLCREIGAAGRSEVLANHSSDVRAQQFFDVVKRARKSKKKKAKFFGSMIQGLLVAKRFQHISPNVATHALVGALKAAEYAVKFNEPLTSEIANHVVIACFVYDRTLGSTAGTEFLHVLHEVYPDEPIFNLAVIRKLLNTGRVDDACNIASKFRPNDAHSLYTMAEEVIGGLIAEMLE